MRPLLIGLLMVLCGTAGADVPPMMSLQGRLMNSGGPMDGTFTLKVSLWDSDSGGNAVWSEVLPSVDTEDGIFDVLLGGDPLSPMLPQVFHEAAALWVGVQVLAGPGVDDVQAELPRRQLLTVAYAFEAAYAETAAALDCVGCVAPAQLAPGAVTLDALADEVLKRLVPPGTVMAFAGTSPPPGWLLCDGTPVSRATYAALFGAIGTAHGAGDGTVTFHLPDYRGRFLRGVDAGAGRDTGATIRQPMAPGGAAGDAVGTVQGGATALPAVPFFTDVVGAHAHNMTTTGGHVHDVNDAGNHSHGMQSGGSHSHTMASAGEHSHSMQSAGAHSHSYSTVLEVDDVDRGGNNSKWSLDNTATYNTSTAGNHTHTINTAGNHTHTIDSGGSHSHAIQNGGTHSHTMMQAGAHAHLLDPSGDHGHEVTGGGDAETRAKNAAVHFIIKH